MASGQTSSWLRDGYRQGDFKLVYGGQAANVLVSVEDFKVVQIASADFVRDVERVTGEKPLLAAKRQGASKHAVVIGTLGRSPLIDELVRAGKLDLASIWSIPGWWSTR